MQGNIQLSQPTVSGILLYLSNLRAIPLSQGAKVPNAMQKTNN